MEKKTTKKMMMTMMKRMMMMKESPTLAKAALLNVCTYISYGAGGHFPPKENV